MDNVDVRTTNIIRDKEGSLIIMKEPIHQEDIITLSVYASNNKASKIYEAQTDTTEKQNS
jgi:hypothetical protein